MCSYETIDLEVEGSLAIITLNRPTKKNAINRVMYIEISEALERVAIDDNISITVVTGNGDYYSSGTDLLESLSMEGNNSIENRILKTSTTLRRFIKAFIDHPKILAAVVNGPAIGIAVTTLALFDIVYCVDTATFVTPFTSLGLNAEGCSSYTFPRLMGKAKASEMLLFNKKITALDALNCGLVSQVFTKEELNSVVWSKLKKYSEELPNKSLIYSKELIRRFDSQQLHEACRVECDRLEERYKSDDVMNAVIRFMGRRSKL